MFGFAKKKVVRPDSQDLTKRKLLFGGAAGLALAGGFPARGANNFGGLVPKNNLLDVDDPIASTVNLGFVRSLGSGLATRSLRSKVEDFACILDWNGVDLSGNNDNASVLQQAMNDCGAQGIPLVIPYGGVMALGSTIAWGPYQRIIGPGQAGGAAGAVPTTKDFYFHLAHTGVGFQTTLNPSIPTGDNPAREMSGVNFYRTQPTPAPGWVPTGHDFDIKFIGCYDAYVHDCMFLDPTRLMQIVGDTVNNIGNARINLNNIKGNPLLTGIDATQVYDIVEWDNIEFWPFWQPPNVNLYVTPFIQANATAFNIGRMDDPQWGKIFAYGFNTGMHFYNQAAVGSLPGGSTTGLYCAAAGMDSIGTGYLDEGVGTYAHFGDLLCAGATGNALNLVNLEGTFARLQVDKYFPARTTNSAALLNGSNNDMKVMGWSAGPAIGGPDVFVSPGNRFTIATKIGDLGGPAITYGGTGDIYTPDKRPCNPAVSSTGGALTSVSAVATFTRPGDETIISGTVSIVTNGAANGILTATLPVGTPVPSADTPISASRLLAGTRIAINAEVKTSGVIEFTIGSSGAYPGADGASISFSGPYPTA